MSMGTDEWQGLLLVVTVIGILAILLIPSMSRHEVGRFLLKVLIWGLILRLAFALVDIWIAFTVYGGTADAMGYMRSGAIIAQHIWRLEFNQVVPYLQWGTDFLEFFTGIIYTIIGPTRIGGYFVYAFLAFIGSYFFYRSFRIAFPQGNERLYAILIFFFPSILLWSNGIGKDSLIFLCISLFIYGSALLTRNQLQGLFPLVLGFLGVMWIRPHIATLLAIALLLSFLVRGRGKGAIRPTTFFVGFLVAGVLAWFLLPRLMDFLGLAGLSAEELLSLFQAQQGVSFRGGAAFQAMDISNPLAFPMTLITILFRPFPWEAHNFQAVVQSLEGLIFIGLVLWRIKSLSRAVASSISNAYLRFILVYIIAFTIAFISVQNFGIIVRQRTMLLPFFFMLISYAPFHAGVEGKIQEGNT